jgi:hypothetical protein
VAIARPEFAHLQTMLDVGGVHFNLLEDSAPAASTDHMVADHRADQEPTSLSAKPTTMSANASIATAATTFLRNSRDIAPSGVVRAKIIPPADAAMAAWKQG